jgi:ankyrin repeat protein
MGEGNSKELPPPESENGVYPAADVSPTNSKLIDASIKGQVETVAKLLKKGKKVDKKDEKGDTALHKAAMHGHFEVADMLLKKGASASGTNNEGFTPFQYAVLYGRKECAKLLLDAGTDVNAQFLTNPGISLDYSINKATGVYVWRIPNFSKIRERKVYSDVFSIVGQKWKLVVYPRGSKGDDNLSCYLEIVDYESLPDGWCTLADFSFSVINQLDGTKKIVREVNGHRFYKNHTDLGFPQLIKKNVLRDKKSGYLVNDTLVVEFLIEVLDNTTYAPDDMSGVHTWKMTDLHILRDRATSSMFKIGNCRWVTAVYPHGKGCGTNLALYLKVAEPTALPAGWSYLANFRFAVVNQNDGTKFSRHVESKNFKQKVEDWGFPQFMKLTQLYEEGAGYVKDNTISVEVQVEIIRESQRKKNKLKHTSAAACSFTPLHWATYKSAADGVELLLKAGANVDAKDTRGRTPLDWAAYLGDLPVATLLIKMGAKATCFDSEGFTPFHKAVLNGHLPLIQLLVDEGADVNAKSLNNTTPLQLAFRSNRIGIAEVLIRKYGADLNCVDKAGRTPLHWAAFNGDLDTTTFLFSAGADISARDNDGYTPLHKAVWRGKLECVRLLLERGAIPTIPSCKGYTAIHVAVQANDIPCTLLLLRYGDDINSQDNEGFTLLHKSVQNGNLCMTKTLLDHGADISLANSVNPSPLQIAIANSDISMCIFLLENGADIQGNTGSLLLFVARKAPSFSLESIPIAPNTLSNDMRSLVNNSQFHDVTFLVDGKPVYAWRGMLSARSDYFRAMFEKPSWKESVENSIQVPQMSYRTFLAVIVYIYTGEIDMPISVEDAQLLLAAANKYILPRLKILCEMILVKVLTVDNVFSIFRHADMHMSSFLHKACVQFIAEHVDHETPTEDLEDILKSETFTSCVISFLRLQHSNSTAIPIPISLSNSISNLNLNPMSISNSNSNSHSNMNNGEGMRSP